MAEVRIEKIRKSYAPVTSDGDRIEALGHISLEIAEGEFVAFFGPNACGKTTLLNCIAGIISADEGTIKIDGRAPHEANIGYIFQDHRETLLPWAKVIDNIAYPLSLRGLSKSRRHNQVYKLLETMNISLPMKALSSQLSGGQQQLVAIARALVYQPDLMLFDEPFSELDVDARLQMRKRIQDIWKKTRATILFVSHEIDEALLLADRVVMLSKRPARVLDIIEVPYKRPRKQQLLEEESFFSIRKRALRIFREAMAQ